MKQVIAIHGWAGSPCTWSHWQDVLEAKGWIWCNANRGYDGSTPEQPNWSIDAQRRVLIAHSLGWHLIDEATLAQATELILLASFGRFIPEGRPGRRLQTGLEGMFRSLEQGEGPAMLERFMAQVAHPLPSSALPPNKLLQTGITSTGLTRLTRDLHTLKATDRAPSGLPVDARFLLIHGSADAVVTPEAHQDLVDELRHRCIRPPKVQPWMNLGHALITPAVLNTVTEWLKTEA